MFRFSKIRPLDNSTKLIARSCPNIPVVGDLDSTHQTTFETAL